MISAELTKRVTDAMIQSGVDATLITEFNEAAGGPIAKWGPLVSRLNLIDGVDAYLENDVGNALGYHDEDDGPFEPTHLSVEICDSNGDAPRPIFDLVGVEQVGQDEFVQAVTTLSRAAI